MLKHVEDFETLEEYMTYIVSDKGFKALTAVVDDVVAEERERRFQRNLSMMRFVPIRPNFL